MLRPEALSVLGCQITIQRKVRSSVSPFSSNLPFTVNELLEKALSSIPSTPCNHTNLGLETLHVMPWADDVTQSPDGNLPKDTQMVLFMMPRKFEL